MNHLAVAWLEEEFAKSWDSSGCIYHIDSVIEDGEWLQFIVMGRGTHHAGSFMSLKGDMNYTKPMTILYCPTCDELLPREWWLHDESHLPEWWQTLRFTDDTLSLEPASMAGNHNS